MTDVGMSPESAVVERQDTETEWDREPPQEEAAVQEDWDEGSLTPAKGPRFGDEEQGLCGDFQPAQADMEQDEQSREFFLLIVLTS